MIIVHHKSFGSKGECFVVCVRARMRAHTHTGRQGRDEGREEF